MHLVLGANHEYNDSKPQQREAYGTPQFLYGRILIPTTLPGSSPHGPCWSRCFLIEDQLAGYKGIERIYQAADVADRLWADIHPGEHAFAANRAFEFFDQYL